MIKKFIFIFIGLIFGFAILGIGLASIAIIVTAPKLPSLEAVTNYQPKIPLYIYTQDGKLIGTYGQEKRAFTPIEKFPIILKNAVIAAEDKRFYEHGGIDVIGITRAMIGNFITRKIQSGASTITQQIAKNFFLTPDKSYTRKFHEALLAYRIERSLTKDQILELYFNQIYLGQRAYGFAAASHAYFNKNIKDLTLAEASMLAGLPKAPSAFNPIENPNRAKLRQTYILNNMLELNMINQAQYDEAINEKLHYKRGQFDIDDNALYVAEMVRQIMYEKYGEEAYTKGFKVYTTINSDAQKAATKAIRKTLRNFTNNHPRYTGAEGLLDLNQLKDEEINERVAKALSNIHIVDNMVPAIVTHATKDKLELIVQGEEKPIYFSGKDLNLVKSFILNDKQGKKQIQKGSIIRVNQNKTGKWTITYEPELQGALISINPETGAINALVGGYNFYQKEFNRVTQAWRQPGSTFKPFIYSAAIEKGLTMSTEINDAPLSLPGLGPNGSTWNPKNANGKFSGFIPLKSALVRSINIASIRILMAAGLDFTHQYIQKFGFSNKQPKSLSLALGSGSSTPLQMTEAYAVFANGGYKTSAYIIDKIYDDVGNMIAQTKPLVAKKTAKQAIDPRNAFIMYKIMQDVTRYGTAARASSLGRSDIAGKTGTTNDQKDAWFIGFTPKVVTTVYIGYDKPKSMGSAGYGGSIALPAWIDYMQEALKNIPPAEFPMPKGVTTSNGNYYYSEWQHTNPSLPLDNRSENTATNEEDVLGDFISEHGTPIPPNNNPEKNSHEIDSLF